MKTATKTLLLLIFSIMLTNCKKQHEAPKEKYCGIEVTGFEIMDLKTIANKGYTYTDEDKALAGDMMRAVEEIPNNSYKAKFSFFMKDENTIGMYIIGPDDQAAVEKISCLLLQEDFDGRLPENRKLLFYTDDHANLVAAIKSKTE